MGVVLNYECVCQKCGSSQSFYDFVFGSAKNNETIQKNICTKCGLILQKENIVNRREEDLCEFIGVNGDININ